MSSEVKRVLFLVGSPKAPGKSVSEALGAYVIDTMEARGWSSETIFIRTTLQSDKGRTTLLEAVEDTDLIILSFPLYVDSLPAPVIRAMELISERRSERNTRFAAISNCGFPEAQHNECSSRHLPVFRPRLGFGVGRRSCDGNGWSRFWSTIERRRRDGP